MTIEISRGRPVPENPRPLGSHVTLLCTVLAVLAIVAASWVNAQASESQPQYRGFSTAGANGANYERIKQGLMAALSGCGSTQTLTGFIAPKFTKSPKNPGDFYPLVARQRNEQAVVRIAFLDDSLGNMRFLHVGQAFPPNPDPALVAAAIQVTRSYAITPASLNGAPISFWTAMPVKFALQGTGGPMGSLLKQNAWLAMLDKANAGDVQSIVNSGYVVGLVGRETGLSRNGQSSLIVDSALKGADFARMLVYRSLSVCAQESVVEPWVSEDAKAGSLQAEMTWAQIMWDEMQEAAARQANPTNSANC